MAADPRHKKTPLRLELSITAEAGRRYVPFLQRYLPKAHALLKTQLRELSLALVGDRRMSSLHQQFMNIDGPTDVLTFPLELDHRDRAISGEVICCVPEAIRQAKQGHGSIEAELLLYAVHGLLHLNGLDDRTPDGFVRMHRMEDRILTQLGVGPVFRAGSDGAGVAKAATRATKSRVETGGRAARRPAGQDQAR